MATHTLRRLIAVSLVPVATLLASPPVLADASSGRTLSIEDRVAAQTAIERVLWSRRSWPESNPSPKSAFETMVSPESIRARVEDDLKKSAALETLWRRPLTRDQLQAEIERIARSSHDPSLLREIFAALGNDPFRIAECLARPLLADRLARSWCSYDERFHGDLEERAERSAGGEREETTYVANDERLGVLHEEAGLVRESAEEFQLSSIVAKGDDRVTVSTLTWPKRSFDAWWAEEKSAQPVVIEPTKGPFSLPALPQQACTPDTWSPLPTDAPGRRAQHTAVWTGSEMIVWGGLKDTTTTLDTGARYDPATDTWTQISKVGAPSPRGLHTAVWTGSEMIVWGGKGVPGGWASGGRYNPATDIWTTTSLVGAPSGREEHSAVWTGTRMIVWGGNLSVNSGGIYDPQTDSWTAMSTTNAPSGRSRHRATWTGGVMVVWGGADLSTVALSGGARYDPVLDLWTPVSTVGAPGARSYHSQHWTGSELIVWGGRTLPAGSTTNTGALYDPLLDSWTPMSTTNAPTPLLTHSSVWTGSQLIVWIHSRSYTPATDTWSSISGSGRPGGARYNETAVWSGSELLFFGGSSTAAPSTFGVLENGGRFVPASDSWVPLTPGRVPHGEFAGTALWTGTEAIFWGGQNGAEQYVAEGSRYQPATGTWTPISLTGAPSARGFHTAVWTGSSMIVWGGGAFTSTLFNSGASYDPIANTWTAIATGPAKRKQHHSVWTGSEMIIWGGVDSGGVWMNTGSRYHPPTNAWTPVTTLGAPTPPRGTITEWIGNEMLVWGGSGSPPSPSGRYSPSSDSWTTIASSGEPNVAGRGVWTGSRMLAWYGGGDGSRYDPVSNFWFPIEGIGAPSTRVEHALAWCGVEMVVWGGRIYPTDEVVNTGARYNPFTDRWLPMSTIGAPAPRRDAIAVSTGSELIVWGGELVNERSGGRYCACAEVVNVYRDLDHDGSGNAAQSAASCAGAVPAGYAAAGDDCDDTQPLIHPGASETCNGVDDDCNALVDDGAGGVDGDQDQVAGACDVCPAFHDPSQSDFDDDGEGDACDLNDGSIFEFRTAKSRIDWQAEQGPTSWNVYEGSLGVLAASGVYTQVPGSNPQADRHCGVTDLFVADLDGPSSGLVTFTLVSGVQGGIEGGLGTDSSGTPRPNLAPCP